MNLVRTALPDTSAFEMLDDDIDLAAHVLAPVLVTSADPDERQMCARLIHASGDFVHGPFVATDVNGDLPHDDVLRHQFDQARGGTLFIDDIATLTSAAQAQLMSLLEEHAHAHRSTPELDARVRVIAGASRHLAAERETGAFSEPLFYRLNVIHVDFINERDRGGERDENP